MPARHELVLSVVASDKTFSKREVRGQLVWVGKCIHCNSQLVVGLDGRTFGATVEHILPKNHGGTDDADNLALACERCNVSKGYRLDVRALRDETLSRVIETLRARRRARLR